MGAGSEFNTSDRSLAVRITRVLFGLVCSVPFGMLAYVTIAMPPPEGHPPLPMGTAILLEVFSSLIVLYSVDQLLSGLVPSRTRWFARGESALDARFGITAKLMRPSFGNLAIARPWGIPVYANWTLPVGLWLFGRSHLGAAIGWLLVVVVHELGHAVLVRRFGFRVEALSFHGFGGECAWSGNATRSQRVWIALGGVLAQAALFVMAMAVARIPGVPSTGFMADLGLQLTWMNATMAAVNLIPIAPLDGGVVLDAVRSGAEPAKVSVERFVEGVLEKVRKSS
ncbi:MAG: hypothetical protein JST92_17530 [Deltaproteobacteria bacterium]|nr:hypothetical protein [Deltaproteobacteria bacterium]